MFKTSVVLKMWTLIYILVFVNYCSTSPGGSLDDLIDGLLEKSTPSATTGTKISGKPTDNIDDLIDEIFRPSNESTSNSKPIDGNGTILGPKNTLPSGNEQCECVPYYQCQEGAILDNGVGLIDIRSNFDDIQSPRVQVDSLCSNYLDVCCSPPNIRTPENKVTPAPIQRTGCGKRNPGGVGFRITGDTDNEAQFGEFPWMVAILREEIIGSNNKQSKLNVYQCGGALIHPEVVLTAAHCVNGKKPSELRIRAGEWDTQTKNEIYPHQDRLIKKIIVHEKFHSGALHNDYALLILTEPVELAENVDVVCLPEYGSNFDYSRCVASGWGKDVFGKEGHFQVILKKIELPVVSHQSCENSLRQTRLGKYYTLDRSFICAGGELGKDTCNGDGGSPLVCPVKNERDRYVQAGIVAWGIGCGENRTPGVYANIAHARPWIDHHMSLNNFDNTVYQYHL